MIYQVTVTDEDGSTIVQLTAPAEVLQEFAGYAVMKAIGADEKTADEQAPADPAQAKARRPRRTKAEMQAAREAEVSDGKRAEDPVPDVVVPDQSGYNPFAYKV